MRDELLNESLFFGLDHARSAIAEWVAEYNNARPHSSQGYATPVAFARIITATHASGRNRNGRGPKRRWMKDQWQFTVARDVIGAGGQTFSHSLSARRKVGPSRLRSGKGGFRSRVPSVTRSTSGPLPKRTTGPPTFCRTLYVEDGTIGRDVTHLAAHHRAAEAIAHRTAEARHAGVEDEESGTGFRAGAVIDDTAAKVHPRPEAIERSSPRWARSSYCLASKGNSRQCFAKLNHPAEEAVAEPIFFIFPAR